MKQTAIIVGIDISKLTLDVFIKPTDFFKQVSNDVTGFKQLLKLVPCTVDVLVVMEHTGKYSYQLETFLQSKKIAYCKINALEIKRSGGLMRGKNDRVDAQRIAQYGWLRKELLKPEEPLSTGLLELKDLLKMRASLVTVMAGHQCMLKERLHCINKSKDRKVALLRRLIACYQKEIRQLEQELKELIKQNTVLDKNIKLLMSVKGIGWIVACNMLCCTNNFKNFTDARKFNAYAGVAPFRHESGTSIRGRSRVSHLANKSIKTYLNLAAFSACRFDPELKLYYQRRLQEGKSKMGCINIIRAKLIARMFAVIRRQTPFEPLNLAA